MDNYLAITPAGDIPAPARNTQALLDLALSLHATTPLVCHPRDLPALAASLLTARVQTLPHGGPQSGTLWIAIGGAA
jgi:hypothetical protein